MVKIKLTELSNCTTIEEAVMFLLQFDNALEYESILKDITYNDNPELSIISDFLMGSKNDIAISVAQGDINQLIPFFRNVADNNNGSIPLILRILQLHIQNRNG
jgi:hypothetical protein